jgi:hypothetical protein
MADLKRNIDKSEILLTLEDQVKLEMYVDIFYCQIGFWTIKYLGAPVSGVLDISVCLLVVSRLEVFFLYFSVGCHRARHLIFFVLLLFQ